MRYRVELEELLAFVEKLEAFEQRAEALAAHVDGQVADLHSSWSGEAADTHLSGHDRWMAAAAQMRESLGELRQTAQAAHRNYREAVQLNIAMLS